jgi:hypothetical protein
MANTKPEDLTISLLALNELLDEKKKSKYRVSEEKGHIGILEHYDGMQGEYNETFRFYKHPALPASIFMKETWQTDSYGDNDHLVGVQFVQGVPKTITVYEPLK